MILPAISSFAGNKIVGLTMLQISYTGVSPMFFWIAIFTTALLTAVVTALVVARKNRRHKA